MAPDRPYALWGRGLDVTDIVHALCLNLHQPAGNLAALAGDHGADRSAEGAEILGCYQRIADHVRKYAAVARVHLAVSSALLQQWRDPAVARLWGDVADLSGLIAALRGTAAIELIGGGLSRPFFARIPPSDWDAQLAAERALFADVLGRAPKGFRAAGDRVPPGLVAALARAGYAYIILPVAALRTAADGVSVDGFRPHRLTEDGLSIAAIPIDEDLSRAQAHGLDVAWFADEARMRVGGAEGLRLVTTWSDGENGAWFRGGEGNFFEKFFSPAMEFCETGEYPLRPALLSEILDRYGPLDEAVIAAGYGETEPVPPRLTRMVDRLRGAARSSSSKEERAAWDEARRALFAAEDGETIWPDGGDSWLDRAGRALDRLDGPSSSPVKPAEVKGAAPTKTAGATVAPPVVAPPADVKMAAPVETASAAPKPKGARPVKPAADATGKGTAKTGRRRPKAGRTKPRAPGRG